MPLHQHHWSLRTILKDWKLRCVKKPRANLPSEFTTDALRYIRQAACKKTGIPDDCEVWASGDRYVAFGDTPCRRCVHPSISNHSFSAALFGQDSPGTEAKLDKYDKDALLTKKKRILRRLINSEAPMQSDDFRRVIANAWLHGWISATQAISIHQNLLELEATSSWLRKFLKRLRNRAAFRRTGIISDDPARSAEELNAALISAQTDFLVSARRRIASAPHITPEDKQWLLRQICVSADSKTC